MSHLSPVLFDVIDVIDAAGAPGERGAAQGVVTLNLSEKVYRQARKIMDAGHRLAIRARPKKRYELSVRDDGDQAVSLVTCGEMGVELHQAAERLISHAYGVLFDPLPW